MGAKKQKNQASTELREQEVSQIAAGLGPAVDATFSHPLMHEPPPESIRKPPGQYLPVLEHVPAPPPSPKPAEAKVPVADTVTVKPAPPKMPALESFASTTGSPTPKTAADVDALSREMIFMLRNESQFNEAIGQMKQKGDPVDLIRQARAGIESAQASPPAAITNLSLTDRVTALFQRLREALFGASSTASGTQLNPQARVEALKTLSAFEEAVKAHQSGRETPSQRQIELPKQLSSETDARKLAQSWATQYAKDPAMRAVKDDLNAYVASFNKSPFEQIAALRRLALDAREYNRHAGAGKTDASALAELAKSTADGLAQNLETFKTQLNRPGALVGAPGQRDPFLAGLSSRNMTLADGTKIPIGSPIEYRNSNQDGKFEVRYSKDGKESTGFVDKSSVLQGLTHSSFEESKKPIFEGSPKPDDVMQGSIGDCWLLSTMASLARQDPQAVKDMVKDYGDFAMVRLWQKPEGASEYQPVWVQVGKSELKSSASGLLRDGLESGNLAAVGAGLQVALGLSDAPTAQNRGSALWPQMVEKAIAKLHEDKMGSLENESSEKLAALTGRETRKSFLDKDDLPELTLFDPASWNPKKPNANPLLQSISKEGQASWAAYFNGSVGEKRRSMAAVEISRSRDPISTLKEIATRAGLKPADLNAIAKAAVDTSATNGLTASLYHGLSAEGLEKIRDYLADPTMRSFILRGGDLETIAHGAGLSDADVEKLYANNADLPRVTGEAIWDRLQNQPKGQVTYIGTDSFGGGRESTTRVPGLVGGHAYEVVGTKTTDGQRYVTIRNPWGDHGGVYDANGNLAIAMDKPEFDLKLEDAGKYMNAIMQS